MPGTAPLTGRTATDSLPEASCASEEPEAPKAVKQSFLATERL